MDEIRTWKCENGHVLGQITRNGRGVTRLLLYREAINYELVGSVGSETHPTEVDVMAVIEGYAADITCSVCGRVRSWVPGAEALRKMITQFERMHGKEVGSGQARTKMVGSETHPTMEVKK